MSQANLTSSGNNDLRDSILIGDDGEDLDPAELIEAEYRGYRFLVPRGDYTDLVFEVEALPKRERIPLLMSRYEAAPRPAVVGFYEWGAESPENTDMVFHLSLLGLQARLADAKKAGEIMGTLNLPIVYARADQAINKTQFKAALAKAVGDQRRHGSREVADMIEAAPRNKRVFRHAFLLAFQERVPGGEEEPRTVVGFFFYTEPSPPMRGPHVAALPPEIFFNAFKRDRGALFSFDFSGTLLADIGERLQPMFNQAQAHAQAYVAGDVAGPAFDEELHAPVSLTSPTDPS